MGTNVDRSVRVKQLTELIESSYLVSAVSVLVGLLLWQAVGMGILPFPLDFAAPTAVLEEWIRLVLEGTLLSALSRSIQHMLLGYVIAAGIAIPLGFLMARSQVVEWAVNPFIDALYSTPPIAYIPLIIVWFGLHFEARVFMVFAMCVFEMLINTYQGISSIADEYVDVAESFDASWWQLQRQVLLPASTPHIFAGLRLGAGRAVRGMIVAELFLSLVNLGKLLEEAGRTYRVDVQFAVIITITVVGVIFQQLVVYAEHRAIPWHFSDGEGA